ncbi:CLUMA_CG001702, isoform A [Clunio marinus]|uniref:CLUMA_CG001702, isoform A n=1 Tax=Clunio marinus TaxID=568069 RepID=A0A1J1HJ19_9DIPT|nr:CLUMA_CG001702, isoform A [Clunio marinus]
MKHQSFCIFIIFYMFINTAVPFITKIQCSTSEARTCIEPFCFFTNNTADGVSANYGCKELSRPLNKINVHFKLYTKMYSQYFQVGYFPKFDYCTFIENIDKQNLLYYGVKLMKERLPESIRECPYIGKQLQVRNLNLTSDDLTFLPAGKYKVVCTFSDDDDYKILRMVTHVKI